MTKFTNVIVRKPGKSLCNGITSAPELGQPSTSAPWESTTTTSPPKQCAWK